MSSARATTILLVLLAEAAQARPGNPVRFEKVVLDQAFRAEGVAVADVNRDGRLDVLAGDLWYEAPAWTPREIRPPQAYDPATMFSNCFLSWVTDLNGDGWPDQIVVGFPGDPARWRANPAGTPGPWVEHVLAPVARNESPAFVALVRRAGPVLVAGSADDQLVWYEPGTSPEAEFPRHPISAANDRCATRFAHGLGVGDLDGDGRADVVCPLGWYRAPRDRRAGPWPFTATPFGSAAAQMEVYDVNRDGRRDVITSAPHGIGVWWWEQRGSRRRPRFVQHLIDASFSQSHALALADLNGDGRRDLVTGKRFWAHGPTGDIDPNAPAVLYWFELRGRRRRVRWLRHQIDDDSGVGTQVVVTDVNRDRRPDVVVANKKGVFLFLATP